MTTFKLIKQQTAFKNYGDKQFHSTAHLLVFDNNEFRELVTVRWYTVKSSDYTYYCNVFVHLRDHDFHSSGSAKADGYGYNKLFESFEAALMQAGVYCSDKSGSWGCSVISILKSLASFLGYDHSHVVHSNG